MYNSILNTKDHKDRSGLLGKAIITTDVHTKVYTVFSEAKYSNINISIVNPNPVNAEVKIWISASNSPGDIDVLESKIVLEPDAVYVRNNVVLSNSETVFARASISGCVIRIDGFENNRLG